MFANITEACYGIDKHLECTIDLTLSIAVRICWPKRQRSTGAHSISQISPQTAGDKIPADISTMLATIGPVSCQHKCLLGGFSSSCVKVRPLSD